MADQELMQQINKHVDALREEIIEALQEILRFETVSGAPDEAGQQHYRDEIARCMSFLQKKSEAEGFEWRNHDNVVALAELKGGATHVALPVHIDVVPVGEGWTQEPFGGGLVDDTVYGRGCQDDKGPVVQMFYAMKILKDLKLDLKRGARMVIGTTEEFGEWSDIKKYFELEDAPEFSIVSDAAFPIINGEKGILNLVAKIEFETDSEPNVGGYRFRSASAGERANIVPPKAELVFEGDSDADTAALRREVERFVAKRENSDININETPGRITLVFNGRGAHGSTPEEGHNAALDLLEFMTESGFVSDDEAETAEFLHDAGKGLKGEGLNIVSEHHFIGSTTVNFGVLRWEGADVEATFNIRNTMGLTVEDTVRRAGEIFQNFADETGFEVSAKPRGKTMEPIYTDPDKHPEFIQALKDSYTSVTGREATLHSIGGTTYSKVFPNSVCFGPVDLNDEIELAHQADERIKVEYLLRNVKIYACALARLCAGK